MKKLDNKGVTLIELIVSFAIVSVAMVYFYQTLYTVRKLYVTAESETQEFVNKDYVIRIVDKFIDEYGFGYTTDRGYYICNVYKLKYKEKNCDKIEIEGAENIKKVTITWTGESSLSFYKSVINKDVKTGSGEIVEKTNDVIEDFIENNKSVLAQGNNGSSSSTFFNDSPITKGEVEKITFASTTEKPSDYDEEHKWDASLDNDGSVIAWYDDSDGNGKYELVIGGNGKVFFLKIAVICLDILLI